MTKDKRTLLIIDDECDIRSLCKCVVDRSFDNFVVYDARSLKEAKEKLKSIIPDIVLLDLHLDDGVGFDLVSLIKKVNPEVKILVITAYNQSEEQRKAEDLGAFGLLGKPFSSTDLVERINDMTK
jgi:response regulator of citrate/malate metabolism